MLLKDKIVFITGGAQGIGYECAKVYVAEGAKLAIADRDEDGLKTALTELGAPHIGIPCDVSNADQVKHAIDRTLGEYGRLDAIHNNAGIASPAKALHETTEAEWCELMDVNLKSIYYTVKYGLEALKASEGTILNTSSLVGEIGQEMHAAYSATKGAINALTKSMALDYAKFRIRVNAVSPAGVWTPMVRQWNAEQPAGKDMAAYLDNIHVLGYCPEGDVVADACAFLLSDKARFITGCILPVSGGAELGYRFTGPLKQ
jgi:meso-butanediol dehydrogenase / (S,S)-butanediol dehydrogenase / diacetyl reductase